MLLQKHAMINKFQIKLRLKLRIDIPVWFADNSQANISVNESRLCLTGSLMRTPLPNRTAAASGASAATPKALRDISFKAQKELASLYDDLDS